MLLELKDKNQFKNNYFEMLKDGLAHSSLQLENEDCAVSDMRQRIKIFNQLNAINYIFDRNHNEPLTHYDFTNLLCVLADKVTGGEITDFRKTDAYVSGSKIKRTSPGQIRNELWQLIDYYLYCVDHPELGISTFEREANLHIRLLHIHPFEDANGRVSRILLAYNLCKSDEAPCIITTENKKEYCNYIENSDVIGLSKFLEKLSKKELDTMVTLYTDLDKQGQIEGNKMTEEEEAEYKKIIESNGIGKK